MKKKQPKQPRQKKPVGRKRVPSRDIFTALVLATRFNLPSRKAVAYPPGVSAEMFERGKPPAAITLRFRLKSDDLTPMLIAAINKVGNCVRKIEHEFAVDATYMKMPLSEIVIQKRGSKDTMPIWKSKHRKLHVAVGIETLMVVGATVTDGDTNDSSQFVDLLNQFAGRFRVDKVYADAAYGWPVNYDAVEAIGAQAYLDFKSTSKPTGGRSKLYDAMLKMSREDEDGWFENFRFRQLVETSNSVMKRTIKRTLRSRLEQSALNELLLVVLVHNLCRLMVARIEHGIEIPWADAAALNAIDTIKVPKAA